jgi:hypothetical protein
MFEVQVLVYLYNVFQYLTCRVGHGRSGVHAVIALASCQPSSLSFCSVLLQLYLPVPSVRKLLSRMMSTSTRWDSVTRECSSMSFAEYGTYLALCEHNSTDSWCHLVSCTSCGAPQHMHKTLTYDASGKQASGKE